jgi:hypothetical protein
MSAPNTDPNKQAKRHKWPLGGIGLAVGVALIGLVVLLYVLFAGAGPEPAEAPLLEDEAAPTIDPAAPPEAEGGGQ